MDPDIHAKYDHNGKVMLGSAILLFLLILIIIFFHTYGHLCFRRHLFPHPIPITNSSTAATPFNEGLDPSVLKFLPIFTYSSATHRPLHHCAICLSEFEDDDEGRILPNCNHAFHSHCIDTWFHSHSNCPLCRAPVHQPPAPVQPAQGTPAVASSVSEAGPVEEECQGGCSSFAAPRKSLGIIIEVPEEEAERIRGSDLVPGDIGLKWSDNRVLSLKRLCSV